MTDNPRTAEVVGKVKEIRRVWIKNRFGKHNGHKIKRFFRLEEASCSVSDFDPNDIEIGTWATGLLIKVGRRFRLMVNIDESGPYYDVAKDPTNDKLSAMYPEGWLPQKGERSDDPPDPPLPGTIAPGAGQPVPKPPQPVGETATGAALNQRDVYIFRQSVMKAFTEAVVLGEIVVKRLGDYYNVPSIAGDTLATYGKRVREKMYENLVRGEE